MPRESDFKIMYCGTDKSEAEKCLDRGDCCAVIYCDAGYGVALLGDKKAELNPETCVAIRLRGRAEGITLSDDFCGRFAVCSGSVAEALFGYYLGDSLFRAEKIGMSAHRERLHSKSIQKNGEPHCGLYDIHTVLHETFLSKDEDGHGASATAEEIKAYIDDNVKNRITIRQISERFFISRTQIFRVFTARYGVSPIRYVLRRKIELSKELLVETDMNITEIAEVLSFVDAKHYTRTFRNSTGKLPRDYRKERREELQNGAESR